MIQGNHEDGVQRRQPAARPVSLRIDPVTLARVDAQAARRGVDRSTWIKRALSRVLTAEEAKP